MVRAAEVRRTIEEINRLRDKFGYESMPLKGVNTLLEWLIRDDTAEGDSMMRGVFGDNE